LLAAAMWIWVQAIAVPHQQAESAERGTPRGNLSDLYPRWLGARELLLHGRDPYGADITGEIQAGYYGRLLDQGRPNDPKDQQAFAYPVYVVFLLAPAIQLPFAVAHKIFFWLFVILTALSVLLWWQTLGWRLSLTGKLIWVLLALSSFPAIQGLKLQQLTVLVAALIAGAMFAITRRHFVLAGILLAVATIKPQLVLLVMVWLCVWALGNWRHRQPLLWTFAVAMLALVAAGEVVLPGWITEFRRAMADYYRYTGGGNSVLDVVLSPIWGRIVSALLVGLLIVFAWSTRGEDEKTAAFQWALSATLATTLLIIPMFAPYNQLLLIPGVMMALRSLRRLWEENRRSRFFVTITGVAIGWPFFAAVVLVVALLFLPGTSVQKAWGLPFYPSFAIPITIYALLLNSRATLCVPLSASSDPLVLRQSVASE